MVKVTYDKVSGSVVVVPEEYGEMRTDGKGKVYLYLPLPYARVPVGHGREDKDAIILANRIADLLNKDGA